VHSQGEWVVQCGHFADKGFLLDANARTFWRKNLWIFQNLWCVRTDFADKGWGIHFSRFCADVFHGRSLSCKQNFLVLFAANRFALSKPASMGWRNVGIRLKILSIEQINIC